MAHAVRKILLVDARLDHAEDEYDAPAQLAAAASQGRNARGPEFRRAPARIGNPREAQDRIVDRRSTEDQASHRARRRCDLRLQEAVPWST